MAIEPPDAKTADRTLVINLRDDCAPGLFERAPEVPADERHRLGSCEHWKTCKAAGFDIARHDM